MWAYAGERKCEWCRQPATRASHDGCYFCDVCAMPGDMYLAHRPTPPADQKPASTGGSNG